MSKYSIGDLVWVPDGTVTFAADLPAGLPIAGPACGLVLKVTEGAVSGWLVVKIGNREHGIAQKNVRKINKEETTYGQVSRSSTNI